MNEFLYRRADIEDVVTAHLRALAKARSIGFGRYIISATTPFTPRRSTASTSMPVRGLSWAGSRVTTSPTPSISSPAATISAVAWLVPSDQRVITTSSSKTAPTLPEPGTSTWAERNKARARVASQLEDLLKGRREAKEVRTDGRVRPFAHRNAHRVPARERHG
jgi:hypothetical protein